jgi:hemolysin D
LSTRRPKSKSIRSIFTRYGLLHVLNLSQDAIARQTAPEKTAANALEGASGSGEPKDQGLLYVAHISLDQAHTQIDDNLVNLSPGMAVTVEIKTGTRRIISYLLSPILRYASEGLHER